MYHAIRTQVFFLMEPIGEIISQWLADVYTLVMGKLTTTQTLARLGEAPLFSAMGQAELAGLLRACLVRDFQARSQVFRPGQPAESFYVILAGRVKISKTSAAGDEQILHLYGPGQTFGEALKQTEVDEGEVVRYFRMTVQILREILDGQISDSLKERAFRLICLINRDIVDSEKQLRN